MKHLNLLLALLLPLPISAQISQMTTTFEGDILYFSIENPLKESGEPWQGRIFKVGPAGLELVESRDRVADPNSPPGAPVTNYFHLSGPEVSDSGNVFVFAARRECYDGFGPCADQPNPQSTIRTAQRRAVPGVVRLSANGRFAAVFGFSGRGSYLIDFFSGTESDLPPPPSLYAEPRPGRAVSGDGAIVHSGRSGLWIYQNGENRQLVRIPASPQGAFTTIEEPVIDGPGRRILYTVRAAGNGLRRLRMYDLVSQQDEEFIAGLGETYMPLLSTDGSRALFLSTAQFSDGAPPASPQLFTVNTDGSGLRQLTNEAGGVLRAVFSGNGRVAWYVAASGRLVQFDLDSGEAVARMNPLPAVSDRYFPGPVPGSMMPIPGEGFTDGLCMAGEWPAPEALCGVRVRIGGWDAPLLWVTPTEIMVQAPWEIPPSGEVDLAVETANASPFTARLAMKHTVNPMNRWFFTGGWLGHGQEYHLARHANSGRWVSPEEPLAPGDWVHVYGRGFGAVDAPQRTGFPAPDDPPARLREPLRCPGFSPGVWQEPVEMEFAGLEPYQLGMYGILLRVPERAQGAWFRFYCEPFGTLATLPLRQ